MTGTITLDNTQTADQYSEGLAAAESATSGGASVVSGLPTVASPLAAGGQTTVTLGLASVANVGTGNAGTVTLALDTSGTGTSGLAAASIGSQLINVSAQGYSGQSIWSKASGGVWDSFDNWDVPGGLPGVDGSLSENDTATFGAGPTGATVVNLDGANPVLTQITFNSTDADYQLAPGSGGSFTLGTAQNAATVTATAGNHAISAAVSLARATEFATAASTVLALDRRPRRLSGPDQIGGRPACGQRQRRALRPHDRGRRHPPRQRLDRLERRHRAERGHAGRRRHCGSDHDRGRRHARARQLSRHDLGERHHRLAARRRLQLADPRRRRHRWNRLGPDEHRGRPRPQESRPWPSFDINLWSLSAINADVSGDAINFDPTQSFSWTIARVTGGGSILGFDADAFNINLAAANGTGGFSNSLAGGTITIEQNSSDLNLVFAPVPEPQAFVLLIAAAAEPGRSAGSAATVARAPAWSRRCDPLRRARAAT